MPKFENKPSRTDDSIYHWWMGKELQKKSPNPQLDFNQPFTENDLNDAVSEKDLSKFADDQE